MMPASKKRVCFLFNHAAPHQVPHSAPIAFELSRQRPEWEVVILSSSRHIESCAGKIAILYPGHRVVFMRGRIPWWLSWVEPLVRNILFIEKYAMLAFNAELIRQFDALVVPEAFSLKLRKRQGFEHLKYIYTHHGAGDRSIGFHPRHGEFDLILCPGPKIKHRLRQELDIEETRLRITGYPKFEVAPRLAMPCRPFANDKPIVLYNPHFSNRESSWRSHGMQVLEYFRRQDEYNLIFAPHVLLYQRKWRHGAKSLKKFRGLPHIHVDTGSMACIDMTYTRMADIYLGDVSSQVYEFIQFPKPCIFIDTGAEKWEDRLFHRFGDVIKEVEQLPGALSMAWDRHRGKYRGEQIRSFRETFECGEGSPSRNAADAIGAFLSETAYGNARTGSWRSRSDT